MKEIYKTKEDSIKMYETYIINHIKAVKKAFELYGDQLCKIVLESRSDFNKTTDEGLISLVGSRIIHHDESKFCTSELYAYAAKFYPCEEDLKNKNLIEKNFEKAWIHHYLHNPHHPEFWRITSSPYVGFNGCMYMSNAFFVEMILDWIGMSIITRSKVGDWWFNSKSGKSEKSTMLPPSDILIIDKFINDNNGIDGSHIEL